MKQKNDQNNLLIQTIFKAVQIPITAIVFITILNLYTHLDVRNHESSSQVIYCFIITVSFLTILTSIRDTRNHYKDYSENKPEEIIGEVIYFSIYDGHFQILDARGNKHHLVIRRLTKDDIEFFKSLNNGQKIKVNVSKRARILMSYGNY